MPADWDELHIRLVIIEEILIPRRALRERDEIAVHHSYADKSPAGGDENRLPVSIERDLLTAPILPPA